MRSIFLYVFCLFISFPLFAQFHNLKIPKSSPKVVETQQLGITNITVEYSSPATRGRDVWDRIIPYDGNPIPWRAGANMNTRIKFSTEVKINGERFPAGSYGFHIIPRKEGKWTLLFASNDNLWGSYYLDMEKEVFAKIDIATDSCAFQENLNFNFFNRTDSTLTVALQWANKSIPFQVEVDLNKTVIASLRYELRGINTNRWEAWNDAASWCLRRNTNLEEALHWAERSISGGYGGFAANKNINNLSTKMGILNALDRKEEANKIIEEVQTISYQPSEAFAFGNTLLREVKNYAAAKEFFVTAEQKYPNTWFLNVGKGFADYFLGDVKAGIKILKASKENAPPHAKPQLDAIIQQMEAGTFQF